MCLLAVLQTFEAPEYQGNLWTPILIGCSVYVTQRTFGAYSDLFLSNLCFGLEDWFPSRMPLKN